MWQWCFAITYGPEDYAQSKLHLFHPEELLSFTVILVWLRSITVLEVFQTTGPLVVIVGRIWRDVVRRTPPPSPEATAAL